MALGGNGDPVVETSGTEVDITLTTVELLGDVKVIAVAFEEVAAVPVEGDVTSETVEVPTVDEDVEETDGAVPVSVVVEGLTPAVDNGCLLYTSDAADE